MYTDVKGESKYRRRKHPDLDAQLGEVSRTPKRKEPPTMMNEIRRVRVPLSFAVCHSILLGIFAFFSLVAPQLSAQVTAYPSLEIFSAPGTAVFTITVPFRNIL